MNQPATLSTSDLVSLNHSVAKIENRHDLAGFVQQLRAYIEHAPQDERPRNLDAYLEALAAWVEAMDGCYLNMGRAVPAEPTLTITRSPSVRGELANPHSLIWAPSSS